MIVDGDNQRRSLPLDHTAERKVGHAGHRGQNDRVGNRDRAELDAHDLIKLSVCLKLRQVFYTKPCCTAT